MQNNAHSRKMLEKAVMLEVISQTQKWRGQKSEKAFLALVRAAIEEAINPLGRVCPACNGSGFYKTDRRQTRSCTHCNDGRIGWNYEQRFVAMCSGEFACTYSVFKRYHEVLEPITKWLSAKRNAAMLALMERIEREEAA